MQVLPSGLVVPPLPYLLALALGSLAVGWWAAARDPPVTERTVLAFAPWMVAGGGLHALYQAFLVPEVTRPLLAAPAVYVTTFVVAGAVWAGATAAVGTPSDGHRNSAERVARVLGAVGLVATLALFGVAYLDVLGDATARQLLWPAVGFLGAAVITAPVYALLARRWPAATDRVGLGGPLVVYAHALDGFSTALGIDVVGTGERTPLPARIMEFAGGLPTEPYLGRGWLFVLVKLVVAGGVVVLLAGFVDEEPRQGNLLLAFVAAVGAGPAANNLFLFLLGG